MATVELKAKEREQLRKEAKKVRLEGKVPAVIYGHKFGNLPVSVDKKEFIKKVLRSESGQNLIFNLKLSRQGKTEEVPVITHDMQIDVLTDDILHIDFLHIVMDEEIITHIPIDLEGEPIGVKEEDGVLVHGLRELEVKSLPANIPDHFKVNVSNLNINESLQVSDLKIPDKVEVLTELEEMIAHVAPPRKEEEEPAPAMTPEEVAAAAEGEAPAEGEKPADKAAAPAEGQAEKETEEKK